LNFLIFLHIASQTCSNENFFK